MLTLISILGCTSPSPDPQQALSGLQHDVASMDAHLEALQATLEPGPLSGVYSGRCENKTAPGDAELMLILNQESSGKITGAITITDGLFGSGFLEGYTDGDEVVLTSYSSDFVITWSGAVDQEGVAGDYIVAPSLQSPASQDGIWSVSRTE